jgi:F0F1-type ATP synthase epsilon subunit
MPDTATPPEKIKDDRLLHVSVRNRESVIYDGAAWAVSSLNDKGVFDILPEHINFITMIRDSLTIHKPDRTDQEYKIRTGLMRVQKNIVEIYVGLAQIPTTSK